MCIIKISLLLLVPLLHCHGPDKEHNINCKEEKMKFFTAEKWFDYKSTECKKLNCGMKKCELNLEGRAICVGKPHEGTCFATIPTWLSKDNINELETKQKECTFDDECEPNEKCCFMPDNDPIKVEKMKLRSPEDVRYWVPGSARKCIRTCPFVNISFPESNCEFGFEKNGNGCPTERCYDPCANVDCPPNYHCEYSDVINFFKRQIYRVGRLQKHFFGFNTFPLKPKLKLQDLPVPEGINVLPPSSQKFIHNYMKTLWSHKGQCVPNVRRELGKCPDPFPMRVHTKTINEVCNGKKYCANDEHCPMGQRCCFDFYCYAICVDPIKN
ncbi:hypothetical protein SNEBB_001896 [Seison nebaliae]|nr:hypothetical protein SNEBB_001896 [Seison nebaliae]